MTEVFITDIHTDNQAELIVKILRNTFTGLKINVDLNDSTFLFPCSHSILRVEAPTFDTEKIISVVRQSGSKCDILDDKICKSN